MILPDEITELPVTELDDETPVFDEIIREITDSSDSTTCRIYQSVAEDWQRGQRHAGDM